MKKEIVSCFLSDILDTIFLLQTIPNNLSFTCFLRCVTGIMLALASVLLQMLFPLEGLASLSFLYGVIPCVPQISAQGSSPPRHLPDLLLSFTSPIASRLHSMVSVTSQRKRPCLDKLCMPQEQNKVLVPIK